jgi:hypothetical protein
MASEKALGKRKMTFDQLQEYYTKHQKVERGYTSDEEQPDFRDHRPLAHRAAHGGLTLERAGSHKPAQVVEVHPDDEHARDLLEALNIPIADIVAVETCANIMFSDDMGPSNL